ncbi:MAG: hypothetical protein WBO43_12495 [Gemmatimonadota bacterium]
MYRSRAVSLALVGLFVWVTACTSYKQIEIADVTEHGQVRVTLTDGERETVRDPRVEADSITGLGERVRPDVRDRVPLSIALDQVETLEATHVSAVKTVGLAVGLLGGLLALAAIGYAGQN